MKAQRKVKVDALPFNKSYAALLQKNMRLTLDIIV